MGSEMCIRDRYGEVPGFAPYQFPDERYWASLAVKIEFFRDGNPSSIAGGFYFSPELPPSNLFSCWDVGIFASTAGGSWQSIGDGCDPAISVTQEQVIAVAVNMQR